MKVGRYTNPPTPPLPVVCLLLPGNDFKPKGSGYASVYYGFINTRPTCLVRAHHGLQKYSSLVFTGPIIKALQSFEVSKIY